MESAPSTSPITPAVISSTFSPYPHLLKNMPELWQRMCVLPGINFLNPSAGLHSPLSQILFNYCFPSEDFPQDLVMMSFRCHTYIKLDKKQYHKIPVCHVLFPCFFFTLATKIKSHAICHSFLNINMITCYLVILLIERFWASESVYGQEVCISSN